MQHTANLSNTGTNSTALDLTGRSAIGPSPSLAYSLRSHVKHPISHTGQIGSRQYPTQRHQPSFRQIHYSHHHPHLSQSRQSPPQSSFSLPVSLSPSSRGTSTNDPRSHANPVQVANRRSLFHWRSHFPSYHRRRLFPLKFVGRISKIILDTTI
jgi:hypothetical protein